MMAPVGLDETRQPPLAAAYETLLASLESVDLAALHRSAARLLARERVAFRGRPFAIDPVPRLVDPAEWERVRAGTVQRVRALCAFVRDVYGERRIVAAGAIDARTLEDCAGYEPALRGRWPGDAVPIPIAGPDVVRDAAGELQVIEDNVRAPSGFGYAVAARRLTALLAPTGLDPWDVESSIALALRRAVRDAAPAHADEPRVVVLSDGPHAPIRGEHALAARWLGAPLVTLAQLELRGRELCLRLPRGRARVDVVYRRLDEERLRDARGEPTAVASLLLAPWLDGRLGIVNPPGTGVADDKLLHGHVETMVRFYLGEAPLLRSVPTLDLRCPARRAHVLAALGEHVVKPRTGQSGRGVTIGAQASAQELRAAAARVRAEPDQWVAQPLVVPSHHPTLVNGRLAPRHVDLRPFAFATRAGVDAVPAPLTRFGGAAGALAMNFSRGGGVKDTWTLRASAT